ncbi:Eco57I restriction-modification methylase domain-containing protein [Cellulomonas carbonis]|uniref:site-specific DNA-methyltransferase (adenine-specific) n=1 Tax=Cellulomonas carbonis T26 TaxID=947969 RepID=A0A0A0BUM1_9CELL|nr:Eco57I restriction-modification methylase domain-containing protein [Cellulomonas carbonis]KGM11665.1 restriction endonuclease [Cellulomonas carbonis T26]GGB98998.1 type III restriction endonuclease [Cellulomonas carbonis]
MTQAPFALRGHNPDILTSIANLSNDEVFTPPELANTMLDLVADRWAAANDGTSIWADPDVTFLDPFTKSGVFLREVTRRLVAGLAPTIPDLNERVDHILTRQVYGIGITRLTSLLARRSVYCSKAANGKHSIAKSFEDSDGNIWFERTEHTWAGGRRESRVHPTTGEELVVYTDRRCRHCGAGEGDYGRGEDLETHAYAFIHTDDITTRIGEIFGEAMQFDVIIGNPPYQLETEGHGRQARPIYHLFVEQAKRLEPRLLTMIVPSRWFSGGMGLDDFRESMLTDQRLRSIDDYLDASDVFKGGMGGKGGVCYFLWDRDRPGPCRITTHHGSSEPSTATRPLLEEGADVFIRFNEGVSILKKVAEVEGRGGTLELPVDRRFRDLVSAIGPFGLDSTFRGRQRKMDGDLKVYRNGGIGYIARADVTREQHAFDKWKVFIGRAAPGTGNRDTYPHRILSTPFLGEPGSISSWTYLYIGPFNSRTEAESVLSYLTCRLTRFLVLLHKPSQDTTRRVYTFVPTQEWTKTWTDAELYEKYGLTDDEIAFIEYIVRPMELTE